MTICNKQAGVVTGTPTTTSSAYYTITATDNSIPVTVQATFQLVVLAQMTTCHTPLVSNADVSACTNLKAGQSCSVTWSVLCELFALCVVCYICLFIAFSFVFCVDFCCSLMLDCIEFLAFFVALLLFVLCCCFLILTCWFAATPDIRCRARALPRCFAL